MTPETFTDFIGGWFCVVMLVVFLAVIAGAFIGLAFDTLRAIFTGRW